MKSRIAYCAVGLLILATGVLTFLLATGEKGLLGSDRPARVLDITRGDAASEAAAGWDKAGLDEVFQFAATLSADAVLIVTGGKSVASFGDLHRPLRIHSIRKALLSTVVAQHLGSGTHQISLDATLADLGIDDSPGPLTDLQKQATVRDLLKSVSGINHPAAAEGGLTAEKDRVLGRKENTPGTKWAYNNWDYNALTTIFEARTQTTVAAAFETGIAIPLGLQDFTTDLVSYIDEPDRSRHRAVAFRMSARDLAAVGQLYLNRGRKDGEQIIDGAWIDAITEDSSETGRDDLRSGHGYLWWLPGPETGLPSGTFWAWGLGNQALFVIPSWDTVIVHQSDTTAFLERFIPQLLENPSAEQAIEELILFCRNREHRESEYCIEHRFTTRREFDQLMSLIVAARAGE